MRIFYAAGLACFLTVLGLASALGQSPPPMAKAADSAAQASVQENSEFAEADRLLSNADGLERKTVEQCIKAKPLLIAEVADRLKNMDREVEESLGKPPPLPSEYSPQTKSLVCDERVPFVKKVQSLFDIGFSGEVLQYYTCLALARHDESACDAIKFIDQAVMHRRRGYDWRPMDMRCKINYGRFLWSKALITDDPASGKICGQLCREYGPSEIIEADRAVPALSSCETLCSNANKFRGEPSLFCEDIQPVLSQYPAAEQACQEKRFSIRVGLGPCVGPDVAKTIGPDIAKSMRNPEYEPCASMPSCFTFDPAYNHCLDTAAFRKASDAKNKDRCGDSNICRALMDGSAEDCKGYAEAHRKRVCTGEQELLEASRKRHEWESRRELALNEKRSTIRDKASLFNDECRKEFDRIANLDERIKAAIGRINPGAPGRDLRSENLASAIRRHRDLGRKFDSMKFPAE